MSYEVSVTSRNGEPQVFACAGPNDQVALIYAGKVIESRAAEFDQGAAVKITRDGDAIGPATTVRDMSMQAV